MLVHKKMDILDIPNCYYIGDYFNLLEKLDFVGKHKYFWINFDEKYTQIMLTNNHIPLHIGSKLDFIEEIKRDMFNELRENGKLKWTVYRDIDWGMSGSIDDWKIFSDIRLNVYTYKIPPEIIHLIESYEFSKFLNKEIK